MESCIQRSQCCFSFPISADELQQVQKPQHCNSGACVQCSACTTPPQPSSPTMEAAGLAGLRSLLGAPHLTPRPIPRTKAVGCKPTSFSFLAQSSTAIIISGRQEVTRSRGGCREVAAVPLRCDPSMAPV